MALYITDEEIRQLITIEDAVSAVEEIMRDLGAGQADNRPRQRPRTSETCLHVLCAAGERIGSLGVKAYTTRSEGNRFLFLLFSDETGECEAVIEADWLGRFRTGAASGVATKYMAREDAETVGVIGTGRHALTQFLAVCAVRPIKQAYVWSPTPAHRTRFAEGFRSLYSVPIEVCETAERLVTASDVVCTITKAGTPVLRGEWIRPGTHINAAGSNHPSRQEIGEDTVCRADLIVVDSLEQAKMECGDLLPVIDSGKISWNDMIELADVVGRESPVRAGASQITLFESHGLGVWDIAVGKLVLDNAHAVDVGAPLPF